MGNKKKQYIADRDIMMNSGTNIKKITQFLEKYSPL